MVCLAFQLVTKNLSESTTSFVVRVAMILKIMVELCCPWIFENPAQVDKEVSVLNLDEYRNILGLLAVSITTVVQ